MSASEPYHVPGEPPLGTIGVVSTRNAGRWLDRFVAWAIQFDTESPVNHAFVYVGEGRILEARPGGSRLSPWDSYPGTIWLTNISPPAQDFYEQEKLAFSLRGIPYGFLDIVAIGIAQKRWSPERAKRWESGRAPWWVKRVSNDGEDICSELADIYYLRLGRHLFNDGRLSGLVSPGDLWRLNESLAKGKP